MICISTLLKRHRNHAVPLFCIILLGSKNNDIERDCVKVVNVLLWRDKINQFMSFFFSNFDTCIYRFEIWKIT